METGSGGLANEGVWTYRAHQDQHGERILSLDAGIQQIDLDDTILRVANVKLNDIELTEGPRDDLLPDQFAFVGYNLMLLYAPPMAGDVLTFWTTTKPQPMRDDGDDPSDPQFGGVPTFVHKAIVDYMCWWAADKLGDQQAGRGERYRVIYEGQDGLADRAATWAESAWR